MRRRKLAGDSPTCPGSKRPAFSRGVVRRVLVASPNSCLGPQARIVQGRVETSRFRVGGLMTAPTVFVGIDVSKDALDVALRPSGERWQVAHDSRGIEGLLQRLGPLPEALVVLEATGGYEQALAAALASACSYQSSSPIRGRCAISHVPLGSWPRQMRSMLQCSRCLPNAYAPSLDRFPTRRAKALRRW